MKNKKVLVISYNFPPMGGGGVLRVVKFCKYLAKLNWQPIVLTVKEHDTEHFDHGLLRQVWRTRVCPSRSIDFPLVYKKLLNRNGGQEKYSSEPMPTDSHGKYIALKRFIDNFMLIPDSRIGWIPFALSSGTRLCRDRHIDIIFSTGGPWTNHLIGVMLKKFCGLPLVVDFRDSWTENPFTSYPFRGRKLIEEKMERWVLRKADRVTTATEGIASELMKKYPEINRNKFSVILNGFDREDFNHSCHRPFKRFTISHTGNFYGKRTPKYFLEAVKALLNERAKVGKDLLVNFAGQMDDEAYALIASSGLSNIVRCHGTVSHDDSIKLMFNSDVLLLIIGKESSEITGKVFEYFAARKPILALTGRGDVSDILEQTGTATIVSSTDVDEIKEAMYGLYQKKRSGQLSIRPNWNAIKKYDRMELTNLLSLVFDNCLARNSI